MDCLKHSLLVLRLGNNLPGRPRHPNIQHIQSHTYTYTYAHIYINIETHIQLYIYIYVSIDT